jgi:hypothetical protein
MLDSIWHKEMYRRFVQLQKALALSQGHRLTPYGQRLLEESLHYASQNTAHMNSEITTRVTQQRDNQVFLIDLEAEACICRRYQNSGVPCGHAIRAIQRKDKAPIDYMPGWHHRTTWIKTYQYNLPPG